MASKKWTLLPVILGFLCLAHLRADTVSLALAEDNNFKTQVATSSNGPISYSGTFSDFSVDVLATGTPPLSEPNLDLANVFVTQLSSGSHSLTLYLTETGISSQTSPLPIETVFSGNLNGATRIGFADYIDPDNDAYETPDFITTFTYINGSPNSFVTTNTVIFDNNDPFSETEVITISFDNAGESADASLAMTSAPEPATGALVGSGAGVLGLLCFRRLRSKGRIR